MELLKMLRAALAGLETRRSDAVKQLDDVVAKAGAEQRKALNVDEAKRVDEITAEVNKLDEEIREQEARIARQVEQEKRRELVEQSAAQRGDGGADKGERRTAEVTVGREPVTYDPLAKHSYFLDMARASLGLGEGDGGVHAARERLARHEAELRVEMPKREEIREKQAQQELRTVEGSNGRDSMLTARQRESVFEKRVNPNRTDGQGGYFVPPLWLIDEYIDLPRFGRVIANSVRNFTLPSGTDSINLPKVATGTATAVQTADAAAVTSTDLTDSTVSAGVKTIAGQQDIAIQLLDQSPISFDEVVFADLIADYNAKLDVQVINGSNASGQAKGILNVSGINAVTYTDATPTIAELWPSLLQSASLIAKNRKLPALAVFSIPSIWYWMLSQLDSSSRPFATAATANAFNPLALQTGNVPGEGFAGNWAYGLPHLNDGNIPSNLGGGTNETRIITARTSDLYLWEGSMRSRVLSEVLSGTLQVRLQVYNYFAFMGDRRPESISVISGTGVIPASGF